MLLKKINAQVTYDFNCARSLQEKYETVSDSRERVWRKSINLVLNVAEAGGGG